MITMDGRSEGKNGNNMQTNHNGSHSSRESSGKRRLFFLPFIFTFIIMFSMWLVLSGHFDSFHMSLGVISSALVAYLSSDLLFPSPRMKGLLLLWVRFLVYIPWLLLEIVKANLHLMYLTFHPRMMDLIDPRIIKFKSRLKGDMALVTFANSITLTPGTITVFTAVDGSFKVHAIDKVSAEALPGEMEAKIVKTFGE